MLISNGITVFGKEFINSKQLDIVLNLTNPTSHYQTIKNTQSILELDHIKSQW